MPVSPTIAQRFSAGVRIPNSTKSRMGRQMRSFVLLGLEFYESNVPRVETLGYCPWTTDDRLSDIRRFQNHRRN